MTTSGPTDRKERIILARQLVLDGTETTGLLRGTNSEGAAIVKDITCLTDFPTTSTNMLKFYERAAELLKQWAYAQYKVLGAWGKDQKRVPPTPQQLEQAQKEKDAIMNSEAMRSFQRDYFQNNDNPEIIAMLVPAYKKYMKGKDPQKGLQAFMSEVGFALIGGRIGELGASGPHVMRALAKFDKGGRADGREKGDLEGKPDEVLGVGVNHTFMYGELLSQSPFAKALQQAANQPETLNQITIDKVMAKKDKILQDTKKEAVEKREKDFHSKYTTILKNELPSVMKSDPNLGPEIMKALIYLNENKNIKSLGEVKEPHQTTLKTVEAKIQERMKPAQVNMNVPPPRDTPPPTEPPPQRPRREARGQGDSRRDLLIQAPHAYEQPHATQPQSEPKVEVESKKREGAGLDEPDTKRRRRDAIVEDEAPRLKGPRH